MILEIAVLDVIAGRESEFEESFAGARRIIRSMKGHVSHELKRCVERPSRYVLLVNWERLEDHTEGFRSSPEYQQWRTLLHHYYDPPPARLLDTWSARRQARAVGARPSGSDASATAMSFKGMPINGSPCLYVRNRTEWDWKPADNPAP